MVENLEPKLYDRNDIQSENRIGFIAQEAQALLPQNWQHIVRSTATEEVIDSDGNIVEPAEKGILQIDYTRLGSPNLWSVCRDLLKRIEDLESELNSQ